MNKAGDRCGPSARAAYRVGRRGELYLCRRAAAGIRVAGRAWGAHGARGKAAAGTGPGRGPRRSLPGHRGHIPPAGELPGSGSAGTWSPGRRGPVQLRVSRDRLAIAPEAIARTMVCAIEQPSDVDVNEIGVRHVLAEGAQGFADEFHAGENFRCPHCSSPAGRAPATKHGAVLALVSRWRPPCSVIRSGRYPGGDPAPSDCRWSSVGDGCGSGRPLSPGPAGWFVRLGEGGCRWAFVMGLGAAGRCVPRAGRVPGVVWLTMPGGRLQRILAELSAGGRGGPLPGCAGCALGSPG